MRSLSIATVLAALVLLASCGGGGGNPGECVSGSTQECAKH
jgi:hypothetical protein